MRYKYSDAFKEVIIRLIIIMLAVDIAMMVWAVRRDERIKAERQQRIEQYRQGCYTYVLED